MNILIIGATSSIARSVSRLYAVRNAKIFLVARDKLLLQEAAIDLEVRGAKAVGAVLYDAENTSDHSSVINSAVEFLGSIDIALICHGNLPNQEECQANYEKAEAAINVNGLSVISLCTEIVNNLRKERKGTLAIITSVAGERGRQPNFVYGAAKSMVSTYLQGLRGSLLNENIHIIDIRPGLVDSPMTAQLEKGSLWSSPEAIAPTIVKGIGKKKHVIYAPFYWRFIMLAIHMIPETIFKRVKI